jgi:hypothetical protein
MTVLEWLTRLLPASAPLRRAAVHCAVQEVGREGVALYHVRAAKAAEDQIRTVQVTAILYYTMLYI